MRVLGRYNIFGVRGGIPLKLGEFSDRAARQFFLLFAILRESRVEHRSKLSFLNGTIMARRKNAKAKRSARTNRDTSVDSEHSGGQTSHRHDSCSEPESESTSIQEHGDELKTPYSARQVERYLQVWRPNRQFSPYTTSLKPARMFKHVYEDSRPAQSSSGFRVSNVR